MLFFTFSPDERKRWENMESASAWRRYIIHMDMDAFYASVEQRDNPQLRGLPVIVGGDPFGRGVVTSASYEARRFGVHSAMPSSHARKLCPGAIFLHPRFEAYREASGNIMAVFHEFSDLVEPMSLDEAYIDVGARVAGGEQPGDIAARIISRIRDVTGLNASAGVSFNKFIAKVASGINKPCGIKVVTPDEAPDFLDGLPVRKFYGIGEATERRMIDRGILTGRDLRKFSREELVSMFGKAGAHYHDIINLRYDSPVCTHHERRSIGKERTLHEDTDDRDMMVEKLSSIASMLEESMAKGKLLGRTLTLRLKYSDRTRISRSVTLPYPTRCSSTMTEIASELLGRTDAGRRHVRLLGISISNLEGEKEGGRRMVQTTIERFLISFPTPSPSPGP